MALTASGIAPVRRQQQYETKQTGGKTAKGLQMLGAVVGGAIGAPTGGGMLAGAAAGSSLGGLIGGAVDPVRMERTPIETPSAVPQLQTPRFSENGQAIADAMVALQQMPQDVRAEYQTPLAAALMQDLAQQNTAQAQIPQPTTGMA